MKFTNTKTVGKAIGKDVAVIGKTSLKLVGDILRMPNAVVTDVSDAYESHVKAREDAKRKAMEEALADQK